MAGCSADQAVISVIGPMSARGSAPETRFNSPIRSTAARKARRSANGMRRASLLDLELD
jgi:hypothetical protein